MRWENWDVTAIRDRKKKKKYENVPNLIFSSEQTEKSIRFFSSFLGRHIADTMVHMLLHVIGIPYTIFKWIFSISAIADENHFQ